MVIGRYKTRTQEFMAFTETVEELSILLRKAWHKHCKETGACLAHFSFSEVEWEEVDLDVVYRDQGVFYREEEK